MENNSRVSGLGIGDSGCDIRVPGFGDRESRCCTRVREFGV
jgi:hypothetical protein